MIFGSKEFYFFFPFAEIKIKQFRLQLCSSCSRCLIFSISITKRLYLLLRVHFRFFVWIFLFFIRLLIRVILSFAFSSYKCCRLVYKFLYFPFVDLHLYHNLSFIQLIHVMLSYIYLIFVVIVNSNSFIYTQLFLVASFYFPSFTLNTWVLSCFV